jgi:Predicted hydrolases or acyltransferases (alpha/beta hydrolase superfamily)
MGEVATVNGLKIFYQVEGRGDPVILLHGNGLSHGMWKHNIGPLSQRFRVYAPDLPGFGQSDKPDVGYGTDYYVRFLSDFMDALAIEKAVIIGHSFLGVTAATFAVKSPGRVTKLVLADACGVISMGGYLYKMALKTGLRIAMRNRRAFCGQLLYDGARSELLDGVWLAPDSKDGRRAFYRNCGEIMDLNLDYLWLLGQVKAPTLVLGGNCDRLVPPKGIRKYGELILGSRTAILERCAHLPNVERPDQFNAEVMRFLA